VIICPFIVVALLSRWKKKKEELKIIRLKELIEQQEGWSTPLFNNGGFIVGTFLFLLGLFSIFLYIREPNYGIPLAVIIALALFGLLMIYGTPFIKITKKEMAFQPLLFKIFRTSISQNVLPFDKIKNITIKQVMPPFNALIVHTESSKEFKLNTALFNSEIGKAIFEIVKSRLTT
jgi:hypothetical protein